MKMQKMFSMIICLALLLTACANNGTPLDSSAPTAPPLPPEQFVTKEVSTSATQIQLSDYGITVNGDEISSDSAAAVYAANDIVFYLEGQDFTYGEGTQKDAHPQAEADKHTVVHITQPGQYVISGKLSAGQVAVDLGKNAEDDPNAVVTLVLNNADITCTVAPAVIFYHVYECGTADEETATMDVDTSTAGANVIIADGSENNIRGSYVARIYKSVELNEAGTEVIDSKKLHKYDGAFYSKMSMNIYAETESTGKLNIYAENEGLDSELHLTVFSGNIHIESGNDGINTNEDNVSVTRIAGGSLDIVVTGGTGEGDGIDSNGWILIDGGKVTASACGSSGDAGLDADKGTYINGGQVAATGNMYDHVQGEQTFAVFTFSQRQKGSGTYTLKSEDGAAYFEYTPQNDFQYLILSTPILSAGTYTLWQGDTQLEGSTAQMGGGPGMNPSGERPEIPDGMTPPEGMEVPESQESPEGMGKPDGEFSEGMTPPNGEGRPEDRPNGMGGFQENNQNTTGESSNVFVIADGGNYYRIV